MHVPRRGPEGGQLQLPPGFRFYPSDEELVVHYLCRKAASQPFAVPIIAEVDLYKYDPWSLPEKALFGEKEWYFFSPRDRKYPNGSRPNRAAGSGYWKATGTDKPISIHGGQQKVGVKKALVFYIGKAPKGEKTNWIMHEYRLADSASRAARRKGSLRLDDWVLCRIYEKIPSALRQQGVAYMSTTPTTTSNSNTTKMESASDHEEELEGGGGGGEAPTTRTTTMTTGAAPTRFDDVLASLPEVDDKKLVRLPILNGTSKYSNQQYPVDPSSLHGGGNGVRGYNMFNANQSGQLIQGQAQSQQMNGLDHVLMQRQAQAQSSESDQMVQIRQGQFAQISGMTQRQQQQYGHDHQHHHQQHYRKGHGSNSASMAMTNATPIHGDQPHHVALSTPSISSRPQPHIDVPINNRDNQLDFFNFDYGLSSPLGLNFPTLV